MKRLKIVFNFITLALTTGLLVMITVAWYAVNKTANVTAGTGSIADLDKIIESVEYYNFDSVYTSSNDTIYRVKSYVYTGFGETLDRFKIDFTYDENNNLTGASDADNLRFAMNEYDYLSRDITKYLIKITLKNGKGLSSLQFISTANYFIGFSSDANSNGSVANPTNLSMSSVIKFGCYLTSNHPTIQSKQDSSNVNRDNAEVIINTEPAYSHFEYTNSNTEYYGAITTSKQTIASSINPTGSNDQVELYILIDYNLDALNAFYSYNLESNWGLNNPPQFNNKDFTIFILG